MANNYKEVKTAKELLQRVKMFGLSTDTESICNAQDIIGHATQGELEELAASDTQTFYMVLFHIWNWEDATQFYNRASNPEIARLRKEAAENGKLKKEVAIEKETSAALQKALDMAEADASDQRTLANRQAAKIQHLEDEIVRLKAKLYDLITEVE